MICKQREPVNDCLRPHKTTLIEDRQPCYKTFLYYIRLSSWWIVWWLVASVTTQQTALHIVFVSWKTNKTSTGHHQIHDMNQIECDGDFIGSTKVNQRNTRCLNIANLGNAILK